MAQCKATANRTGERCQKRAVAGATICRSHGAAAVQVKRRAAERVALEQARALLGQDGSIEPDKVLLESVRAAGALLHGATAALAADDADSTDAWALSNAAQVAAKLARLCLDAGLAERADFRAQLHGELVAGLIKRIIGGAGLPHEQETALYVSLAAELRRDGVDIDGTTQPQNLLKIDAEIAMLEAKIREHEQIEAAQKAMQELPARIAGAVSAGFAVADLDEPAREKVAGAVEGYLRLEREAADHEATTRPEQPTDRYWTTPPGRRNGGVR